MEQTVFELDLLEEARDFLKSLTKEIRGKIGYNIRRVQTGERDNELFKKLDGTEIWEFRTCSHSRHCEEDTEDAEE